MSGLKAYLETVNNQLPVDLNGSVLIDDTIGCIQLIDRREVGNCTFVCGTLWGKESAAVASTQVAQSPRSAISFNCSPQPAVNGPESLLVLCDC